MHSSRISLPASLQDYAGFIELPNQSESGYTAAVVAVLTQDAEEAYPARDVIQAALTALTDMRPDFDEAYQTYIESREVQYVRLKGLRELAQPPSKIGKRIKGSPSVWIFTDQGHDKQHYVSCESIPSGCCGYEELQNLSPDTKWEIYAYNAQRTGQKRGDKKFLCNTTETMIRGAMEDRPSNIRIAQTNQARLFFTCDELWEEGKGKGKGRELSPSTKSAMYQDVRAGTISFRPGDLDPEGYVKHFNTYDARDSTRRFHPPDSKPDMLRRGSESAEKSDRSNAQVARIRENISFALSSRFWDRLGDEEMVRRFKEDSEGLRQDWETSEEGQIAALFPSMPSEGLGILEKAVAPSELTEEQHEAVVLDSSQNSTEPMTSERSQAPSRGKFKIRWITHKPAGEDISFKPRRSRTGTGHLSGSTETGGGDASTSKTDPSDETATSCPTSRDGKGKYKTWSSLGAFRRNWRRLG